jgi:uncharacterized protein YdiU (UPF0061 family)
MTFCFDNSYAKLGEKFFRETLPQKSSKPQLLLLNKKLLESFSDRPIDETEITEILSGNKIPKGAKPIALAYAGHQFGHFVESLGDGRAVLLGEILNKENQRFDLQLKGSGKTFFSRNGDGLAPLPSMLREYLLSEAMHHLGIKTTRSLAVVATGDEVIRQQTLPGAVLTRIAASHIRIGTFEYFAAQNNLDELEEITNYTIKRHYAHLETNKSGYQKLVIELMERQIDLVCNWMCVGFIHGVMNSDNMTLSGETIDYGPCAFLDEYDPQKTFSSIDRFGRYAFNNQPRIALWNCLLFAEAIALLTKDSEQNFDELQNFFVKTFQEKFSKKMLQKLGIIDSNFEEDIELLADLLNIMTKDQLDYTLTFRFLSNQKSDLKEFFIPSENLKNWIKIWQKRLTKEKKSAEEIADSMQKINPAIIARNHAVEELITNYDSKKIQKFLKALQNPFEENLEFMQAPKEEEKIRQTFCGT